MALRQIMTPNGPVLVSDEEAAAFGLPDPMGAPQGAPVDFGAPVLPPPAEEPVPDVAFNPPLPVPDAVSGTGAVVPGMAPRLTPGLADSGLVPGGDLPAGSPASIAQEPAPEASQGRFGGGDQPAGSPPPEQREPEPPAAPPRPAKSLSDTTYDELVQRQDADTAARTAAAQSVGEAEGAQADAVAAKMEENNRLAAEKMASMEEAQRADQAAIAQKAQAWEAKQAEWMNTRVKRRGMNAAEIIGAAIAGLGSAMKGQGDRNPALDLVRAKIQEDIDDQVRERDQLGQHANALKGSLDYASQVAGNAQAQRMAAYGLEMTRQGEMVKTVAAKMESPIKRANAQKLAADMQAEGAASYGQALQLQHGEDRQEEQLAQQERESRRAAGMQAARIREDARQFDATDKRVRDLAQMETEKEINAALATGNVEKAKAIALNAKEERELGIGGGPMLKGGKSPNAAITAMNALSDVTGTKKVAYPGFDELGRLLQPDGSVFKAPDQVSAQALRKQVKAAVTSSEMIDEVLRLRDKHGWSSDLFKSDEWRAMQANKGAIIVEAKNAAELGALSGPDMDLIVSMMGTKDPTEMRDPAAGLVQMKRNMQRSTRNALTTAGYAGDAFDVPDASSDPKAQIDPDTKALSGKGMKLGVTKKDGWLSLDVVGITRDQELDIEALTNRAKNLRLADGKINPDADKAVKLLVENVAKAPNPKARAAAFAALVSLRGNPFVDLELQRAMAALPGRKRAK